MKKLAKLGILALAMVITHQARAQNQSVGIPPSRSWGLFIGVSNYDNLPRLSFASRDAAKMADTLTTHFGFSKESLVTINGEKGSPNDPTRANIVSALDSLTSRRDLDQGDLFIFYFSGHGLATPKGDYLCPRDVDPSKVETQGIPVKMIVNRLVEAGLKNVLIITDACREGAKNAFGQELKQLAQKANLAVLLGCSPGAKSYEYPSLQSGIFTHVLCEELKSDAVSDRSSGSIWASGVAQRVSDKVKNRTAIDYGDAKQTPYVFSERTQDVLLGVRWQRTDTFYTALKQEANQLQTVDRKLALKLLEKAGVQAGMSGDFAKACELLATIDRLGGGSPIVSLTLGLGFLITGRTSEAIRVLDKLATDHPDTEYGELAIIYSPSTKWPRPQRAKLVRERFLKSKTEESANEYIGNVQLASISSQEAIELAYSDILAAIPPTSWLSYWIQGERASATGDWSAVEDWCSKQLEAMQGKNNKAWLLATLRQFLPAVKRHKNKESTERVIQTALRLDPNSGFWRRELQLVSSGEIATQSEVVVQMRREQTTAGKLQVLEFSGGIYAKDLFDEGADIVRKYPTSWEAHLIRHLCLQSEDWTKFLPLSPKVIEYAPSPRTAVLRWASAMANISSDLRLTNQLDDAAYAKVLYRLREAVVPHLASLTVDDIAEWDQANNLLLNAGHWHTLHFFAKEAVKKKPITDHRAATLLMDIAVSAGDIDLMRAIAKSPVLIQPDLPHPSLRFAQYLLLNNRFDEGEKLVANPPAILDVKNQALLKVLRLVVAARKDPIGTGMVAGKEDFDLAEHGFLANAIFLRSVYQQYSKYMAAAPALFDDEFDGQVLRDVNLQSEIFRGTLTPGHPDVIAEIERVQFEIRKYCKSVSLLDEAPGEHLVKLLMHCYPTMDEVGPTAKVEEFAGTYKFTGTWLTDGESSTAEANLEIKRNGSFELTLNPKSGKVTIKGKVDAYGNLKSTGDQRIRGRIASETGVKTVPQWRKVKWRFRVENKNGSVAQMMCDQAIPDAKLR